MEWQPIEAAPKDGTWVLLTGGSVDWEGAEPEPPAVVAQYVETAGSQNHWHFAWYDGGYYGEYFEPTHFMPIPEPPTR